MSVSGQTAQEYLKTGIGKHNQQDYKSAIKDYVKAISLDKNLKDAFFNRGTCQLAMWPEKIQLTGGTLLTKIYHRDNGTTL